MLTLKTTPRFVYRGQWTYSAEGEPKYLGVHYFRPRKGMFDIPGQHYNLGLFTNEAAAMRAINHHVSQYDKEPLP